MKATARIKRIISHSAIALALGCAVVQPASAQLTTIDPAHIGLQLGSWAANAASWAKDVEEWNEQFQQWKKNLTQWTSTFKSQLSGAMGKLTDTSNASTRESDLDAIITQMQNSKLCDKVKVEGSKTLCEQEQSLKIARAKRIVKALKDSSESLNKINNLVDKYNNLVQSASTSTDGGESNTKKGEIDSVAKEIDVEQQKVQQAFAEAQKDIQTYDSQISMVHGLRVDVARIQLEGQEPGLLDKLAITAGVGTTLKVAADKYKSDIESIKSDSKTNNNY